MNKKNSDDLAAFLRKIADKQVQTEAYDVQEGPLQDCFEAAQAVSETLSELSDSEMRYRNIVNHAVDAIILIDQHGTIQSCNEATTRLLGYSETDMQGKNVKMLMPEAIASEHDQYLQNHLTSGVNKVIGIGREVIGKKKNGETIDLFLSVSKMKIKNKIYFAGILHDITQDKKNKEDLILTQEKTNAIVDTAVDAIIVINTKGIIQSANIATTKLFGYESDYLVGQNVSILTPAPIRAKHDQYLKNYLTTGDRKIIGVGREVKALRKDGTEFDAHLSVSEVKIAGEHLFTGIVRDISVQKEQEAALAEKNQTLLEQNKQKEFINQFHDCMRGEQGLQEIIENTFRFLSEHIALLIGAAYFIEDEHIQLIGQYALSEQQQTLRQQYKRGEGLIGECIKQKKVFISEQNEENNLWVQTTFVDLLPQQIILFPITNRGGVIGVLELGLKVPLKKQQQHILQDIIEILGINLATAFTREMTNNLLEKTQTQEEELRVTNEQLTEQTQALQASEENLRVQSEELRVANEELNTKMELVEKQTHEIELQRQDIEKKARNLALASQYKSEFLANMSHELRTPLNSLLLLSTGLAKNREGNLSNDQIEDIEIIQKSGKTLLNLISDILDLSKVEAGKLELVLESIALGQLIENLNEQFSVLAKDKALDFTIENNLKNSKTFHSDPLRVEQILRNLLSNAFKFTEKGHIKVIIDGDEQRVQFIVEDTGIGIPPDKQTEIFRAFQQADGSTARHYGGTGLGLAICKKLANLLGGEIDLEHSTPKAGSRFSLTLPWQLTNNAYSKVPSQDQLSSPAVKEISQTVRPDVDDNLDEDVSQLDIVVVPDDRLEIDAKSKSVLIIEDDEHFAKYLMRIAHKKQYKCITALTGESGLRLAKKFLPKGIILDLGLPDISGAAVLDKLKNNLLTRHIPVHIVSGKESKENWKQKGVIEVLMKPASEERLNDIFNQIELSTQTDIKKLLIIEDDESNVYAIKQLLAHPGLNIESVSSVKEGLAYLQAETVDCVILDYQLPDGSALDVLTQLGDKQAQEIPPVIIYTGKELSPEQYRELSQFTQSFVVKGAQSPERLLDEVTLFLHSVESTLQNEQKVMLKKLHQHNDPLAGASVMLVDDDLRNSFALSKQLRHEGVEVIVADSGQLALDKLEQHNYVDLILMDIMMPDMDGYETMQHIRNKKHWEKIPIIALTAKAMSNDKQKCLDAGANDYLPKPVDLDKLLDAMRVWVDR